MLGAAWVAYDTFYVNTQVNFALKLAWPIILFSFSVIGLVAYRSRSWSGCGCGSDVTATNGTIAAITGPCS